MTTDVREADVLAFWQESLGSAEVGLDTDFFLAGGKSLLALQLLKRVGDRYEIQVPLHAFVSAPTPRGFTARLRELRAGQRADPVAEAVAEAVGEARHLGVQLYVSLAGRVLHDVAFGLRENGEELQPDDLLPWFSGGKPLTAVAVARLWRLGKLDLDAPLIGYLPEFAAGKQITARQLLTHTGGRLRAEGDPYSVDPATVGYEKALVAALTARAPSEDEPGLRPSYSASAYSWLLLSELVRRLDGRRFDQYVAAEISEPLGLEAFFGFTPEQLAELGPRVTTYRAARVARHNTAEQTAEAAHEQRFLASGDFHRALDPAEGLWASARSLGRFYEHICAQAAEGGSGGKPRPGPLDSTAARELIRPQRPPLFDEAPLVEFGLGVTLESRRHGEDYAYFGSHTGLRTFGHQGHGWSPMAYADPDRGLVVAFNGNGLPGRVMGKVIWHRISDAVYATI